MTSSCLWVSMFPDQYNFFLKNNCQINCFAFVFFYFIDLSADDLMSTNDEAENEKKKSIEIYNNAQAAAQLSLIHQCEIRFAWLHFSRSAYIQYYYRFSFRFFFLQKCKITSTWELLLCLCLSVFRCLTYSFFIFISCFTVLFFVFSFVIYFC